MTKALPKKILYIISDANYFLSHRLGIAKKASEAGYEVSVLAFKNEDQFVKEIKSYGFKFYSLNQRAQGLGLLDNIKLIFQIRKGINSIKPDLIHTVSMRMVFLTTIAFWISKSKNMVATLTGMGYLETSGSRVIRMIKWFVTKAFKIMFSTQRIHLVVQNSDDYKAVKNVFIEESRLHLVKGSGVDINVFPYLEPPNNKTVKVTFVARMLKDKGVLELIEAAKIIKSKGYENIQIVFVGDPHDVNPFSLTKVQLQQWHDAGLVVWQGFRSDIVEVWRESDIAVLPSYREGLPKSLLEAAACGRPIITTDVPGCREMVNAKNGLLVEVKNAEDLAEAIIELAADKSQQVQMGLESRKLVVKYFADSVVNEHMINIYRNINRV